VKSNSLLYCLKLILAAVLVLTSLVSIYLLFNLFIVAGSNVKLGAFTAAVSVIALLYNNARQQSRDIASRHFSEKREAYQRFFDLLFELTQAEGTDTVETVSVERAREIVKSIMVWGSAETINAYNEFMRFSAMQDMNENPKDDSALKLDIFEKIEKLLKSMRKDLGHSDGKLETFSLAKLFIKGDEHYKFPK
jgi:hypothetical protein